MIGHVILSLLAAVAAAADNNQASQEELRLRLQSHVEAQVKKLLETGNPGTSQSGATSPGTGGVMELSNVQGANGGKLQLNINLPPDLAQYVDGGKTVNIDMSKGKVQQQQQQQIPLNGNNGGGMKVNKIVFTSRNNNAGGGEGQNAEVDATVEATDTEEETKTEVTLCPLGKYSETGIDTDNSPCVDCPEGRTTLKLGSTKCEVVTTEDFLGMFYDLMGGELCVLTRALWVVV